MATQIIPLGRNHNLVDVPDKAAARGNLGVTAAIDAAASAAAAALTAGLATKQDTLVSGTNLRTVNGSSLLGSGDVSVSASVAPLVLGTNLVEQRNGTAGQRAIWYKTYTNATNNEGFEIDAAGSAANFDLAACIGSLGGVARGIRIGGKNAAGTFTPWLSFATNGAATFNGFMTVNSSVMIAASNNFSFNGRSVIFSTADGRIRVTNSLSSGFDRFELGGGTSAFPALKRNGTAINFRLADDSADAPIRASSLMLSANLDMESLPTSDPAVAGRVWRSGNDLKISTG